MEERGESEKSFPKDAKETDSAPDRAGLDEALLLVGSTRTTQFSEEYNRRLRLKLVRLFSRSLYRISC